MLWVYVDNSVDVGIFWRYLYDGGGEVGGGDGGGGILVFFMSFGVVFVFFWVLELGLLGLVICVVVVVGSFGLVVKLESMYLVLSLLSLLSLSSLLSLFVGLVGDENGVDMWWIWEEVLVFWLKIVWIVVFLGGGECVVLVWIGLFWVVLYVDEVFGCVESWEFVE